MVGVDGAKHLWVGEKYAARVLNEIVAEVLPGGAAAALPEEWDGPGRHRRTPDAPPDGHTAAVDNASACPAGR